MHKFGAYTPKKIISALKKAGFQEIRTKGSHVQLRKESYLVTVPFHNKDLNIATFKSILRQSGLTMDELKKYL
jgi:predicted RNA binding protein YcfA (HicA-like mRNA interferase family)